MSVDAASFPERPAVFLDFDGTLVDIAPTPQAVHVPDSLKRTLRELEPRLDGALALVSGRALADLDRMFAPHRFAAAGVHGCELREPTGRTAYPPVNEAMLDTARERFAAFASRHPGVLVEDKGYALALHYRLAADLADDARAVVDAVLEETSDSFDLQLGKCVLELRPSGYSKGSAISAFMEEAPFAGRTPVFIGDDVTDEDGFRVVNALGGLSMRVGRTGASEARHRLPDVAAVHRWLDDLLQALPTRTGA
ncbi:MAG: trehalose-phosphatase [Proteobacteria bacterium]|nr:MAG: trehalose-phosphatase [Pseudomonadota bacterium]